MTTVTGGAHLNGQVVQIWADGAPHPDKTMTAGSVPLEREASVVHLGLGFVFEAETQRFIGGGRIGTDQGQVGNIQRVVMRLLNTLGLQVGSGQNPTGDDLETIVFREGQDPMNAPPPLYTGDKEIAVPGGWKRQKTIYFRQDNPGPATVLAVMPKMTSGER